SSLFLKLKIQNALCCRFDVTASAFAAAGFDLRSRLRIHRVERRNIVTCVTAQRCVWRPLVAELGGIPAAPPFKQEFVFYLHRRSDLWIKIIVRLIQLDLLRRRQQLMTSCAISRSRLQSFRSMASKADGMIGRCLERTLFQPERFVGQILRWLGHVFVIRFSLRLISLVANRAALWVALFAFSFAFLRWRVLMK